MKIATEANLDDAATDLADLILMGSINFATLEFGVVDADVTEPAYDWLRRRRFYEGSAAQGVSTATNL